MVTLTPAARAKFLEITEKEGRAGQGLRVIVRGAGTPRPEFALNFVEEGQAGENDEVFDLGELKVYVDRGSVEALEGAEVDFIDNITESGFKVDAPNAGIPGPSGPLAEAVRKVIDERINPAIASHGGHVELMAMEDETAYLKFGGGCQGCGMINVTLKQGVEKMIFEHVPQIKAVRDITDHAAGENPYYRAAE